MVCFIILPNACLLWKIKHKQEWWYWYLFIFPSMLTWAKFLHRYNRKMVYWFSGKEFILTPWLVLYLFVYDKAGYFHKTEITAEQHFTYNRASEDRYIQNKQTVEKVCFMVSIFYCYYYWEECLSWKAPWSPMWAVWQFKLSFPQKQAYDIKNSIKQPF